MKEHIAGSSEVRWFFEGALPQSCLDWFFSNGLIGEAVTDTTELCEGLRVDDYLLLQDCQTVGVKVRGADKFEVKAIIATSSPLEAHGASYVMQRWVKWTCDNDALRVAFGGNKNPAMWFSLKKWRYLRKFVMSENTYVEVLAATGPLPQNGCNIELTRLETVDGRNYFT